MEVSVVAATSAEVLDKALHYEIIRAWRARAHPDRFTIALSGGSLPSLLSTLPVTLQEAGVDGGDDDPKWDIWHVFLADERCVPASHADSNLAALKKHLLDQVPIPASQIYGIDESKLSDSTEAVAADYEQTLKRVLGDQPLDLAILGFGPDGHTCSLFPDHAAVLEETTRWILPVEDSPKPPPRRITFTLPLLNEHTRQVLVCGAGATKRSILQSIWTHVTPFSSDDPYSTRYMAQTAVPPPYPCAMVAPRCLGTKSCVVWIVDAEAMQDVVVLPASKETAAAATEAKKEESAAESAAAATTDASSS